uniref:Uncharacterized protein n=1 Tax=viral metagenome TaxID=1070528 RepID=A0A6H1ZG20_9ZZZZ
MTDEQRKEALEITHKKVEAKDRPPLNLLSLIAVMDGDKAIRSEEYRVLYEFIRSALEPKVVTEEQIETMWQSTCDCFTYYHESYRHLFVKALLEWFKELGIEVKEENK